jgi:hypothetical protein
VVIGIGWLLHPRGPLKIIYYFQTEE